MSHVICDLDGVLWRGQTPVPGARNGLQRLEDAGCLLTFATNNSTRTPDDVAAKISSVVGVDVDSGAVCTSAVAAATVLTTDNNPALVVGEEGLISALAGVGIGVTGDPLEAGSVVVGLTRTFDYQLLADAAGAVRNGARFVATNLDPTFPTSQGLAPGSGSIVSAVATASGVEPEVAGKPHRPMADLIATKAGHDAWVVGDRIDTDIDLAANYEGWTSVLVLTGVTTSDDPAIDRADHVVKDFPAAVDLVLDSSERS